MWAVVFVIGIGLTGMAEAQFYMGEQGWGQGWAPFSQYGMQGYYPAWGGPQYPPTAPYQGYQAFGDFDYAGYGPAYPWAPVVYGGGYYSGNSGPSYFISPVPAEYGRGEWDEWSMWGTVEETPHSWEAPHYGYGYGYTTPLDDPRRAGGAIAALYAGYRPAPGENYVQYKGESLTDYLYRIGRIPSLDLPDRSEEASEE